MSKRVGEVSELDLLAYVDGQLDDSPERRKLVEDHLRTRPDEAARVRAFAIQTREIRARYEHVLAEPVPPALEAMLDSEPARRWPGLVARIAAALALVIVGAGGGWIASELVSNADTEAAGFAKRVVASYRAPPPPDSDASSGRQPVLGLLPEQVAVNIDIPDLGALGLRPVDRRRLAADGGSSEARIDYTDADGKRVVLVVGTRWQEGLPDVEIIEIDGLAVAVWQDGPLRYGLATQADRAMLRNLAKTIVQYQEREIKAVPVKPRDLRAVDVRQDAPADPDAARDVPLKPKLQAIPSIN